MKIINTLILVVVILISGYLTPSYAQYAIQWDDPIDVSPDGLDNNRPRMALDAAGQPMIIWGRDAGKELYFSRWDGAQFVEPTLIVPPSVDLFTSEWAGPELGSNGDVVYAVFKRYPENEFGAYFVKSVDGGLSWSDTVRIDNLPIGDMQSRFPSVAVDELGNPAVTMMTFTGNYIDPEYEVLTSTDGGQSFGPLVNASTDMFAGEACDCCTATIVYSEGKLVQLYRNNSGNIREIRGLVSDDWGATFEQGCVVDVTETFSNVCFSSGPDGVLLGDELITAFRANIPTGARVYASSYNLVTNELEEHQLVDGDIPSNVSQHNAKIAGNTMDLAMCWEEYTAANSNIILSYSSSGVAELVNYRDTVNVVTAGRQVNPDIAYSNGVFHVVWQDKYSGLVVYRRGTVVEATAINETTSNSLTVCPNPTTGLVEFTTESRLNNYKVFSSSGQEVLEGQLNMESKFSIDLSSLDNGYYSIRFTATDHQFYSQGIIKF
jgi:hypothetical protein